LYIWLLTEYNWTLVQQVVPVLINGFYSGCRKTQKNLCQKNESELFSMKKASDAIADTLKEMRSYAQPGMTTKQLDNYGAKLLSDFGAKSVPYLPYSFPGCTCVSLNNEFCHVIPSDKKILQFAI
jgi:methionine aminopeptidase